jgi:hypothetical protein
MRRSCEETMKEVTANVTRDRPVEVRPAGAPGGIILLTKLEHVI